MMAAWGIWWAWIVAALVFAMIEILVPVFAFLGMAVGAVVVGAALGLGALGRAGAGLPALLLLFAASSVVAALALRSVIGVRRGQVRIVRRDIND